MLVALALAPAAAQTAPDTTLQLRPGLTQDPFGPSLAPNGEVQAPAPNPRRPSTMRLVRRPIGLQKTVRQRPETGVILLPGAVTGGAGSPVPSPPVSLAPSLPAIPERPRRKIVPEEDPWAPLGTRVSGLILRPALELEGGYDSNPNRVSERHKGSALLRAGAEIDVQSDWVRHSFTANWKGTITRYPQDPSADRPEAAGKALLRLDVLRDTQVDLGIDQSLTTSRPGSVEQPTVGNTRPTISAVNAALGVQQRLGMFNVQVRGLYTRLDFQDIAFANGTVFSQAARNYDAYGLQMRAAYDATPTFSPFVLATFDKRVHDRSIDENGFARDSRGQAISAGATFEISRILTGEASVGYGWRDYDDARLGSLHGGLVNGSLLWLATPLTQVKLKAATAQDETSVIGASGATTTRVGLEVDHALRRNLILTGTIDYAHTAYQGAPIREDTWLVGLKLDYKLTRSVVLRASVSHERLSSTVPGSDYTANVVLVGLRLQH